MSHNYLLDLNKYVDARITSLTGVLSDAAAPSRERCRTDGRLAALNEFRSLLCREYFPKLPKRLYRQLSEAACEALPPRGSQCAAGTIDHMTGGD